MDMHQGQMCKIRRRSDGEEMGVYQKLRASDGRQRFYHVQEVAEMSSLNIVTLGDMESPAEIECSDVIQKNGSTNNDFVGRPYEIAFVIPTELQVGMTMIPYGATDGIEEEAKRADFIGDIVRRKRDIEKHMNSLSFTLERYRAVQEDYNRSQKEVELERIVTDVIKTGVTRPILYVYGKHDGNDREFCWIAPRLLEGLINVGSRVVAETSFGDKEITVTDIEYSQKFLPHKFIIRLADSNTSPADGLTFGSL